MTREVTLAATQSACGWDIESNLATAERLVREAAGRGAQIVLLQELFATPYFPITQESRHFDLAGPAEGHPVIARFSRLAGELGAVLPVSFFERAGQAFFNSVAMIDADGAVLGVYRKSHIPDSGGYQEKYYFSPGDTGFRVWDTAFARIGVGICWDQWFPECARAMALQGAEVLFYPTAIGSDPPVPEDDSRDMWQAVQRGHAIANATPVVASNRIGLETAPGGEPSIRFYGSSFIAAGTGALLAEASRDREEVVTATVDLDAARYQREDWSFFRDRRPELYEPLLTLDGMSGRGRSAQLGLAGAEG
jgi:N-carbamoylputrescine amidase